MGPTGLLSRPTSVGLFLVGKSTYEEIFGRTHLQPPRS
ncbi:hypothetical protein [Caudoviricetes sp.]|nr:hypothetical protein [Caudoviricetes sp.]